MSKTMPRRGNAKHPWEKWTNGRLYQFQQGVQFDTSPRSFANTLYKYASDNGLKVEARVNEEAKTVHFQFKR